MADAQRVTAEIARLSRLGSDDFVDTVVEYVMGGADKRATRDVQGAALEDPRLAARTLEALETAIKQAKSFNPRRDGESKREQQARIVPWRERIKAATGPVQDVVDDLAHEHAKQLAALDDEAFADRWAAFVLGEPVPAPTAPRVEALAFRSPRVAARGAELCKLMFQEPARWLPAPERGESRTARERRVELFRRRVQSEARFLRYALQYAEARQGRMPSEPNIRLQALRLLGQAHPEELSKLQRQVRGEDREAGAAARRDRRDLRRAAQSAR
ncbi:hypothetical protein ABZ804_22265 [Streptomyces sp. NPDC047726]|uniref:hypothetical protein n=1 Tax=unclassified Streptomyces TaxID=2593676 RepID=UPI00340CC2C3